MNNKKLDVIVAISLALLLPASALGLIIVSFMTNLPIWDRLLNILIFAYMMVRSMLFIAYECDEIWEEL